MVSLDTAAYDITGLADPRRNEGARGVWSVFGTPEENAASGLWAAASPLRLADASDPPFLLVIQQTAARAAQATDPAHGAGARARARRGARGAARPRGHRPTLGARRDRTRETTAVMRFVRRVVLAAR